MDFRDINKRKFTIRAIYYSVSLICVGVLAGALRHAYRCLDISLASWSCLYIAIAAYIAWAIINTRRIRVGVRKVGFHSLALQLAPLCVAIPLFCIESSSSGSVKDTGEREEKLEEPKKSESTYRPVTGRPSQYERYFNDMQDKQKEAALRNGLAPFESRAKIEEQYKKLRRSGKLVRIESNSKYIVRDLTYSAPFVVPKVEELLEDIADVFQQKTQSKSRFMVTSVLRTKEDIAKLRKINGNASAASCHCNATTIDVSYVRFDKDEDNERDDYELRMALAQTMHEFRKAGRCYIKIERKQYCYHITVR